MTEKEITDLLQRYTAKQCTPAEINLVESWYNSMNYDHPVNAEEFESIKRLSWDALNPQLRKQRSFYPYAAIFWGLLFLSIATYFIFQNYTTKDSSRITTKIQPVGYRAMLLIGSKDSVDLNALQVGKTVNARGIWIKKLDNGTIAYEMQSIDKNTNTLNKLIVPRGGQFKIRLADSSLVFVNSESELEFPSQFEGNERRIKMVGEGYFEVAKNKQKPFIVESNEQQVTVLGTKFNIHAYRNEKNITTTLIEGKVRVSSPQGQAILQPGDQAIYNGHGIQVSLAKNTTALTWKDDIFVFDSETLGNIMQQLSRWYNIEVQFANKDIGQIRFTGSISKHRDIDQVLHLLEITGKVKFTIDNKKIYVKTN
ncbi:MAG: FecR family protein [Sphingobacterium sp.]|jgi:hypothetical protein|uniref:FecR family protein n=1 Tax=Sphingobacterium sp. TaxID=341027 RepID=UPI0028363C92|nr:FecR family protein [Sphingobacterium sp.]MDR0265934.1 FecR family protein [Sphingobacterium sp.]